MDGIALEFEDEALKEIARQAITRKSGARGLRSIIEGVMLDTMFELPVRNDVSKCVITADAVKNGDKPQLVEGEPRKRKPRAQRTLAEAEPSTQPEPSVS